MLRWMVGFSLLELLVTLFIAGMMSSMVLASFPDMIRKYRSDAHLENMRGIINIARHAAITKNIDVVVCPRKANGCGPRNSWHRGTLVFEDHNRDRKLSKDDVMVAQLSAITDGKIVWRAFRNRSYLLFTPSGLTDWQNGHLRFCPDNGDLRYARQVVLNYAGRTYSSKDADGDGVHEDVRGRPLTCA